MQFLALTDRSVGNRVAKTRVVLRLCLQESPGHPTGNSLLCLWASACFTLHFSSSKPFSFMVLLSHPTPAYFSWCTLQPWIQMLKYNRNQWRQSGPIWKRAFNHQGMTYHGVSLYHWWRLRSSWYWSGTRCPYFINHHFDLFRNFGGITTDFLPPRQLGIEEFCTLHPNVRVSHQRYVWHKITQNYLLIFVVRTW